MWTKLLLLLLLDAALLFAVPPETYESLQRQLMQNSTKSGTKLDQTSENITIRPTFSNCQKAKLLNLTRVDSGLFYFNPSHDKNWDNAKQFCVENGMQLVTLKSSDMAEHLKDANPNKKTVYSFWVDASDIGNKPGHFSWADGTTVASDLLDSTNGNPDGFITGQDTCVYLWTASGKLRDYPCNHVYLSFICKLAEKDLLC